LVKHHSRSHLERLHQLGNTNENAVPRLLQHVHHPLVGKELVRLGLIPQPVKEEGEVVGVVKPADVLDLPQQLAVDHVLDGDRDVTAVVETRSRQGQRAKRRVKRAKGEEV
jgi:hypothetical protein